MLDHPPVLIVTGASSGIGRELALQAAQRDFAVVAVARRKTRLDELAATITADGGRCMTLALDVRDPATPKTIVSSALQRFGRIDVLINNAGMGAAGTLLEQSDTAIDAQWQTHVAAPLRITREAFPSLRAVSGQVFFVGSGLARVPAPGFGAYCAAKAAIRAVAIQMRRELRGSGVAVTYVDPGAVDTEFMHAAGFQEGASAGIRVPADRVARRILQGVRGRPARLNAVPWQTAGVAVGELFPRVADAMLSQMLEQVASPLRDTPTAPSAPTTMQPAVSPPATFTAALEPVARRMERVNLPPAFIAQRLQIGDHLHLGDLAMQWTGMPNKHERAALAEVLDTLAAAGFLKAIAEDSWEVLREAGD